MQPATKGGNENMKSKVTIKDNPANQERDRKIKEISFYNADGEYFGCLMSVGIYDGKPVINLYRIDEGIMVHVDDHREKRI